MDSTKKNKAGVGTQLLDNDPHDEALHALVGSGGARVEGLAQTYPLVVLGGGTAGLVTAAAAAGLGTRVLLIERHLLGGDCLNSGCVPSKALLAAGHKAKQCGDALDFSDVMTEMRRKRAAIGKHDSAQRFTELGVDVAFGSAKFTGPKTISIGGREISFRRAVVATGGHPFVPPIEGLDDIPVLTSENLFALQSLPARLVVLGGGPIGVEMAQAFARLGSSVQLVEMADRILPREDADAARLVRGSLERDGVNISPATGIRAVSRGPDGSLEIALASAGRGETTNLVEADSLLVAVGRRPNIEGLGFEKAGVRYDESGVETDDFLRTTNRRIYAAGDVARHQKFTHAADFMARTVVRNALFGGRARWSDVVVPWATYTDPEVAHVGRPAIEAQQIAANSLSVWSRDVDRSYLENDDEGFAKVHVDSRGRLLAATVVGRGAGDIIGYFSLAMQKGMSLSEIASAMHPYPSRSEIVRKLADAYNRTRLTPTVGRLLSSMIRLRVGK